MFWEGFVLWFLLLVLGFSSDIVLYYIVIYCVSIDVRNNKQKPKDKESKTAMNKEKKEKQRKKQRNKARQQRRQQRI